MDTHTLIWMFPIAFMFHDFEEIILGEPWLHKNAGLIRTRLVQRLPPFFARQIDAVLEKPSAELAFSVSLIFALTCLASFLAVVYGHYGFFLVASGAFFLHGFMHLGQAVLLRQYIPAALTSAVIVLPYGLVLFPRLIDEGLVDLPGLLVYSLAGMALVIPLILVMHKAGSFLYHEAVGRLIGR